MDFPNDVDGDALRMIAEAGSDFTKPMDVDIQVAAPDEETAIQVANAISALGYRTEIYFDDDVVEDEDASEPWTCECSKVMLLDYQVITEAQDALNVVAKQLSCYVDGWSTFGNAD